MLLRSSIPLTAVDMSKTLIIDKDSAAIESLLSIDKNNPTLAKLNFGLTENNNYDITLFPGALKDFYGKFIYIDVWATWCGPCKAEIPSLKKLESKFKGLSRTDNPVEYVQQAQSNALLCAC